MDPGSHGPGSNLKRAERVRVVEPTLESRAGHAHSFLASLVGAAPEIPFEVWSGVGAGEILTGAAHVRVRRYFRRRVRRVQELFLLRRLGRGPGRIFLPTASTTDLVILALAKCRRAHLFFHWLRPDPGRMGRLRRLSGRLPDVSLLAPTEGIAARLREAGFRRIRVVPYPLPVYARPPAGPRPFRHLLYAGAARRDKGFHRVVDVVEELVRLGSDLPVTIQASAKHFGKTDAPIVGDLERLGRVRYPALKVLTETLTTEEYRGLFPGAITLQLYDAEEFSERVSVVTIDAMTAGSPVIAPAGSWMGRVVERFGAGIVLERLDPAFVLEAARRIRLDYAGFSRRALRGGAVLCEEHSPRRLADAVLE